MRRGAALLLSYELPTYVVIVQLVLLQRKNVKTTF